MIGWILLAHWAGDYPFQNHTMALNKTSSWNWTLLHISIYGLFFLPLVVFYGLTFEGMLLQWLIITGTHGVIDRYRLANKWCDWWGVGTEGNLLGMLRRLRGYELDAKEGWWFRALPKRTIKVGPDANPTVRCILMVVVDNFAHMAINTATLMLPTVL